MATTSRTYSREHEVGALSGWAMLPITLLLFAAGIGSIVLLANQDQPGPGTIIACIGGLIVCELLGVASAIGYFTLQPNQARVLVLFGAYRGTVRANGFHWANPFYTNGPSRGLVPNAKGGFTLGAPRKHPRMKVSLRARNLNGERLKVNDKQGNPIEIAAVIVWRVEDTAMAMFDVDDYEEYVRLQSESALRHLCSQYSYDHGEQAEVTLRGGADEVTQALVGELGQRLAKAGVTVDEARLTHLAYAPEIAQTMLRRQQAQAVIAARTLIVQGAVSMVDMALRSLAERQVVELDSERRAAMASNLLVVLCGESETKPVINTGTLYA
jgi:regulator of protease activity HflC (stomatin/prohibitin superfamily)